MEGYKIVDNYLSSIAAPGGGSISYTIGEQTVPLEHCGPLAVFRELDDALDFLVKSYHGLLKLVHIFECEYEESSRTYLWIGDRGGVFQSRKGLPRGTRLAESVTLLEEVELEFLNGPPFVKVKEQK